ncbi:hypothetical protein HYC85_013317 [Camellia sinensis]|uniref:Uncharacterized protein n=1 Tax=Camellia sinensis TaxID=4442 RepID=A0A7J7H318_CAMSI|nr:hypothetical protein HYC85_013317 [Camellia sinensis]
MFSVHLATILIIGTGINPARNLRATIIYNKDHAWDDYISSTHIPFFFLFFFPIVYL